MEVGNDVIELHHVVPKFMTGWARGRVVALSRAQHDRYHAILDQVLARNRMPRMTAEEGVWEQWIANNAGRFDELRGALIESVELFKKEKNGVDMWADLVTEMTRQGFALR